MTLQRSEWARWSVWTFLPDRPERAEMTLGGDAPYTPAMAQFVQFEVFGSEPGETPKIDDLLLFIRSAQIQVGAREPLAALHFPLPYCEEVSADQPVHVSIVFPEQSQLSRPIKVRVSVIG